jgi:hypothetical protein
MNFFCLLQTCRVDYSQETQIQIIDAVFHGCSSSLSGGAVSIVRKPSTLLLRDCSFTACSSLLKAGAIFFFGSSFDGLSLMSLLGLAVGEESAVYIMVSDIIITEVSLNHSLVIQGDCETNTCYFWINRISR